MISQQVNNSVNIQSVQSAQVSGGTNIRATKALGGVTRGLIGVETSVTSGSGSAAGLQTTGNVSNLLGTNQGESSIATSKPVQQMLQERNEAAFDLKDPLSAANYHVEIKGDNYNSISDYASNWNKKAASAALAGTSVTANGQDPTAMRNMTDLMMTPDQATQYYRDVIGIKTYGSNPSKNVQVSAPNCFQDGSFAASMDKWHSQVRDNLSSKNSLPSFYTNNATASKGLTSYFQNTTPSVSEHKNVFSDYNSMLTSLESKNSFTAFTDNSIAYEGLAALYQNGTIADTTKLSDNSAVVPEFDYSTYMQQVQDLYGQGYDSMLADCMTACGGMATPSISPDVMAVQNLQTTAMSTNELVVKYNDQMTDGILSLSELKAMYDKAFSANGVAGALLA